MGVNFRKVLDIMGRSLQKHRWGNQGKQEKEGVFCCWWGNQNDEWILLGRRFPKGLKTFPPFWPLANLEENQVLLFCI